MSTAIKHIAVAGNIGAGKTSLAAQLSKHYSWDVMFEDASDNPYLSDFYFDMSRWSFNLQIHFLHSRYKQILAIRAGEMPVIQDRTIYEDANIFAPNLYEMGLMTKRDFDSYQHLFHTMSSQIDPPDLLIYLKGNISTLVDHIQTRGRDYEGNMSLDYLKKLNKKYDEWIDGYQSQLLIVPIDDLDFINRSEDLGKIVNMIDGKIHGLFS
ncbi:MAG: deoxynucleoside kinase [Saprospiraceae bacterium]|jgi:deoxyadenosine/deoxycytidine kinase|nr:deoxynucleoside kinase [Saprospiraceae bacterium]MBK6481427.1 deoxynucleoside kinase [Saprospiraceae bacterium]MBK6815899.1 deoxynucleoside kinase [Saprospiraceae bacterium]MBK7370629.1 deoxynucleoside kinase [Saprospiraceae bacterium]MBK7438788.1 deoxynucleoside kinase [Saprospiraceae bacterium]